MKKPKWLSEIKALGWDLDGTLYKSNAKLNEEIKAIQYEAVGKKFGWDLAATKREYKKRLNGLGSNTKTMNSFGFDGVEFFSKVWLRIDLEKHIREDRKIPALFSRLKHLRHFLISNSNPMKQIKRKVSLIGLDIKVFELVVDTVKLSGVKPDPKPFLVALEKLELDPRNVMFVGDKVTTDVMGAKGVEMRTCLVWGKSSEADICLKSVYELEKLFV